MTLIGKKAKALKRRERREKGLRLTKKQIPRFARNDKG
jgi:hypothetical protein